MFSELIEVFKDWPVIIQGALGSALFWIALGVGQKFVSFLLSVSALHSKLSRKSWLVSAQIKYKSYLTESDFEEISGLSFLIYRSLRLFYKSLMWLVLGLISNLFISPIGIIGFMGCIYYLFQSYDVVSPIEELDDGIDAVKDKLIKINKELDELKA
jgi:hypothetical protein